MSWSRSPPPRRSSAESSPSATWSTTPTARRSPPPAAAPRVPSTPSGTCATCRPTPRSTGARTRAPSSKRSNPPSSPHRCRGGCVVSGRGRRVTREHVFGTAGLRIRLVGVVVAAWLALGTLGAQGADASGPGYFSPTGSMSTGRAFPAMAPLPDGRVLVVGGTYSDGNTSATDLSSAEIFDPATNSFSSAGIGSMTVPRSAAVAAPLPDGRVLVAGGVYYDGSLPVNFL